MGGYVTADGYCQEALAIAGAAGDDRLAADLRKLNLSSRAAAAAWGVRSGLI